MRSHIFSLLLSSVLASSIHNILTDDESTIELSEYPDNHKEEWCVTTACDNVELSSASFKVEDGFDFVWIRDDVLDVSWKFTGEQNVSLDLSANFTVVFNSDHAESDDGFVFEYACKELANEGCLADDGVYNSFWNVLTNCSFGVEAMFNSSDDFPEQANITIGNLTLDEFPENATFIETNDFEVSLIKEDKSVVAPFNLCWQCFVPEVEIVAVELSAECAFEWDASLVVVGSAIYEQRKEIVKHPELP